MNTNRRNKRNTKKRSKKGDSNPKRVVIKKSTNPKKKYMAVFYENGKRIKTTHFGCAGMSDYTKHKDPARKQRYMNRHKATEDWSKPMSAGALSRYILWNKPTLKASISDYKKRFNYS
tara:strand:+ start:203 stop:556 length:354 start_codon:yes stop_codon:yes gene_type:complete